MLLESRLCDLFGYRRAVLFGSGRAGLYAVLHTLQARTLVGPSNCCPAVVHATQAGERRPHYLMQPPNAESGEANPSAMVAKPTANDDPIVWMPTHLYGGHTKFDLTGVQGFVLENDTLAVTAGHYIQPVGDALLVSFADGKTISAGAGGAVLTDDISLAENLEMLSSTYPLQARSARRAAHKRLLIRRAGNATAEDHMISETMDIAHCWNRDFHRALDAALTDRIPKAERMGSKWEMWYDALQSRGLLFGCINVLDCAVPWRFTAWTQPDLRDEIVAALREHGFDAGTNYPNLARSFPKLLGEQTHADSDLWASRVFQLWLTEDYSKERIAQGANIIRRIAYENVG